jgi:hypothetical protein
MAGTPPGPARPGSSGSGFRQNPFQLEDEVRRRRLLAHAMRAAPPAGL